MPNERNRNNMDRAEELRSRHGTVGKGMDSPDSTEVPLDASTGEPDLRTREQGREGSMREPNTRNREQK